MFIQIEDPAEIPRPPEEVQIRSIEIDPYADGRRIRVLMELTPFLEPPDLTLRVLNQKGEEIANLSIIAVHQPSLSVTVHLRGPEIEGCFTMEAVILYEELGQVSRFERAIELPLEDNDASA